MNELMKKHKAAVAQVPCPGAPTAPCAQQHLCAVAVPAAPGAQSRVGVGYIRGLWRILFSTHSFPRPPGTWLR